MFYTLENKIKISTFQYCQMLKFNAAFQFQYGHRNETLTGKAESGPSFCIPRHMSMHTKFNMSITGWR